MNNSKTPQRWCCFVFIVFSIFTSYSIYEYSYALIQSNRYSKWIEPDNSNIKEINLNYFSRAVHNYKINGEISYSYKDIDYLHNIKIKCYNYQHYSADSKYKHKTNGWYVGEPVPYIKINPKEPQEFVLKQSYLVDLGQVVIGLACTIFSFLFYLLVKRIKKQKHI